MSKKLEDFNRAVAVLKDADSDIEKLQFLMIQDLSFRYGDEIDKAFRDMGDGVITEAIIGMMVTGGDGRSICFDVELSKSLCDEYLESSSIANCWMFTLVQISRALFAAGPGEYDEDGCEVWNDSDWETVLDGATVGE